MIMFRVNESNKEKKPNVVYLATNVEKIEMIIIYNNNLHVIILSNNNILPYLSHNEFSMIVSVLPYYTRFIFAYVTE